MSNNCTFIKLCCLAVIPAFFQVGGCATKTSQPIQPVEMQAAGYDCTVQTGQIQVRANLDLSGNILGAGFLLKQEHNFDGFTVSGSFNKEFLLDEVSGVGSILLWPPIKEWSVWESKTVITEVLRPSEGELVTVETLPPRHMAGYVFIPRSWHQLQEMNSGVDFLTFKIKSGEGEVLYQRDFDTQQFWKVDHTLKQAASQMREEIESYQTQCEFHESRPYDIVVVT